MTTSTQNISELPLLPGRLGNPDRVLKTDPRADPRLVAACAPFALDVAPPPVPVMRTRPWQDKLAYVAANEAGMEGVFTAVVRGPPTDYERGAADRGHQGRGWERHHSVYPYAQERVWPAALRVSYARRWHGRADGCWPDLCPLA